MSDKSRQNNQRKRKQTPKSAGSNARERARIEAALAARKRRDRNVLIGIAVALVLLVGGGIGGFAAWRQLGGPGEVSVAGPEQVVEIQTGQPILYGAADAPTELTVYVDFACPHCATFETEQSQTLKDLEESGDVRVAYRPLLMLANPGLSMNAANAFACAAERGFGQSYMEQIFASQSAYNWNDRQLVSLAEQVGGEASDGMSGCITRKQHADWVRSIDSAPRPPAFSGTPGIFVGDNQVQWFGGQSPVQFTEAVRAAA